MKTSPRRRRAFLAALVAVLPLAACGPSGSSSAPVTTIVVTPSATPDASGPSVTAGSPSATPTSGLTPTMSATPTASAARASAPVTADASVLANAMVPAYCQHPAMRLTNYRLSGLDRDTGAGNIIGYGQGDGSAARPVAVDLDGDGVQELVSAFSCNAGRVPWPDAILVHDRSGRLLGWADLRTVETTWDRLSVQSIRAVPATSGDGRGHAIVQVSGREYGSDHRTDTLAVTMSGGEVHVRSVGASGQGGPGASASPAKVVTLNATISSETGVSALPDNGDLRSFARKRLAGAKKESGGRPVTLVAKAYDPAGSLLLWGKGFEGWTELWGRKDGHWMQVIGWTDELPECSQIRAVGAYVNPAVVGTCFDGADEVSYTP